MKYIKYFELDYSYRNESSKIKKGDIYHVYHFGAESICKIIKKLRATIDIPTGVCIFEGFHLPKFSLDENYKELYTFRELASTVCSNDEAYIKATNSEKQMYYELMKKHEKYNIQKRFDL